MCFAVIAGRLVTTDGSVLFGHNEQNFGRNVVNYRRVPRRTYLNTRGIRFSDTGYFPFKGETYSYLWVESPGLEFSDNCFNEFGVAVAGNGCPTKEDDIAKVKERGDISEDGIGYKLPQIIAMLARTASEGIEVAARFIERFGYTGSGRTLTIADANEAWVMSIVRGKHYLANRVPDDKVAIVPNTHIVNHEIDLNNSNQTRISEGLIEYAISRGWYDPDSNRPFSFKEAFSAEANKESLRYSYGVDSRQWYVQSLLTGQGVDFPPPGKLPFAVVPKQKLDVKMTMDLLRSHLENIEDNQNHDIYRGLPHRAESEIDHSLLRMACNLATQESTVFQLRSNLPPEIGCLAWRALSVPCLSVYTPWYCGINKLPFRHNLEIDYSSHYSPPLEMYQDKRMAFWSFYNLAWYCNRTGLKSVDLVRKAFLDLEQHQFMMQKPMEDLFMKLWQSDKELCLSMLTEYSGERAAIAELKANQLLNSL